MAVFYLMFENKSEEKIYLKTPVSLISSKLIEYLKNNSFKQDLPSSFGEFAVFFQKTLIH